MEIEITNKDIAKVNPLALFEEIELDNGKVVKCLKDIPKEVQCIHCHFEGKEHCHLITCTPGERKDNNHVHFKLIKE